jgi:hypothetical protein
VSVALGTLVRARVRLDVLVESSLIDVSDCHRSHRFSELASTASPSPLVGVNKPYQTERPNANQQAFR